MIVFAAERMSKKAGTTLRTRVEWGYGDVFSFKYVNLRDFRKILMLAHVILDGFLG